MLMVTWHMSQLPWRAAAWHLGLRPICRLLALAKYDGMFVRELL